MSFQIGQQVVCVSDRFSTDAFWRQSVKTLPRLGSIYTIREICEGSGLQQGIIGFCLYEIVNPRAYFPRNGELVLLEPAFDSKHFRPVKRTSIDVFERLLAPKRRELVG